MHQDVTGRPLTGFASGNRQYRDMIWGVPFSVLAA